MKIDFLFIIATLSLSLCEGRQSTVQHRDTDPASERAKRFLTLVPGWTHGQKAVLQ
uniref:Uncharacterized protein n=1 Tax=Seriola lalandi dorsalis TaxID=1841481 RepID=A0A3B4XHN5_SERLL